MRHKTKDDKVIRMLRLVADDVVPFARAKVAAAIVVGGEIISIGVNGPKTHPMQAMFSTHPDAIYRHAEIDAITSALKRFDKEVLEKSTLYVVRRKIEKGNTSFVDGLAKPCGDKTCGCTRAIHFFKIPKTVYTIDDETLGYFYPNIC